MQPHQERVVVEKAELDSKIEKLHNLIHGLNTPFQSVDAWGQARLQEQLRIMNSYSDVLDRRIKAFKEAA